MQISGIQGTMQRILCSVDPCSVVDMSDVSEESAASISTHPKDGGSRFGQNARTYPPYNGRVVFVFKKTGFIYIYICVA